MCSILVIFFSDSKMKLLVKSWYDPALQVWPSLSRNPSVKVEYDSICVILNCLRSSKLAIFFKFGTVIEPSTCRTARFPIIRLLLVIEFSIIYCISFVALNASDYSSAVSEGFCGEVKGVFPASFWISTIDDLIRSFSFYTKSFIGFELMFSEISAFICLMICEISSPIWLTPFTIFCWKAISDSNPLLAF